MWIGCQDYRLDDVIERVDTTKVGSRTDFVQRFSSMTLSFVSRLRHTWMDHGAVAGIDEYLDLFFRIFSFLKISLSRISEEGRR